jgi:nicotinate-nucleotide adenylyltransferase
MKIGLLFGSFNPIHVGHLVIANYMSEFTDLDQVWLVVSPRNPLKSKKSLSDARKRLTTVRKAVGKNRKIKVSDIEFSLPQPSYTIHSLQVLNSKFPKHKFVLIIGSDNLSLLPKWKDYKEILFKHQVYVYPRFGSQKSGLKNNPNIKLIQAPRIDISSTFIRDQMKKGKDVSYFIPGSR